MSKKFTFHKILFLESLAEGEYRIAERIHEDVIEPRLIGQKRVTAELRKVQTWGELEAWLTEASEEARGGVWPIIHFDSHGQEDGLRLANGELVRWAQLAVWTTRINAATQHNLMIVLSACYGAQFIMTATDLSARGPFYGILAPAKEMPARELCFHMKSFYEALFDAESLNRVVQDLRQVSDGGSPQLVVRRSEDYFKWVFVKLIRAAVPQKARRLRLERLITETRTRALYPEAQLSEKRRLLKSLMKTESKEHFEACKEIFFSLDLYPHRREDFDFTFEQLRNWA